MYQFSQKLLFPSLISVRALRRVLYLAISEWIVDVFVLSVDPIVDGVNDSFSVDAANSVSDVDAIILSEQMSRSYQPS